jgi:cob(I)alamin adenosyltransferase
LQAQATSLADNRHVKELLDILQDNGKSTQAVDILLAYAKGMEDFVAQADSKIEDMNAQLAQMREIQNHPVKSALRSAVQSLESAVASVKIQLSALRSNIVEGCKNAATAFRDGGTRALDNILSFFKVKPGLQMMKNSIVKGMGECDMAIAKIDAFATEYHSAGHAIKNMFRLMIGRPVIDTRKENGRLARAIAAPYRAENACLRAMKSTVDKAIGGIEGLEKTADRIRGEHAERQGSLAAELDEGREKVEHRERERQTQQRLPPALAAEL